MNESIEHWFGYVIGRNECPCRLFFFFRFINIYANLYVDQLRKMWTAKLCLVLDERHTSVCHRTLRCWTAASIKCKGFLSIKLKSIFSDAVFPCQSQTNGRTRNVGLFMFVNATQRGRYEQQRKLFVWIWDIFLHTRFSSKMWNDSLRSCFCEMVHATRNSRGTNCI